MKSQMKTAPRDARDTDCDKPRKAAGQRIFEVARDLFYQRGIRAVGVDEIVCEAGVTKPSLYRSYESKDALVTACLESYARDAKAEMQAAIDAAGDDPRDRLRAVVSYYAERIIDPEFRGCVMSNTAVEFPEAGHPCRTVVADCKLDFRHQLVSLTREMTVREPEALADGLLLLIEGAYSTYHIFGSQGPSLTLLRAADALMEAHRLPQ